MWLWFLYQESIRVCRCVMCWRINCNQCRCQSQPPHATHIPEPNFNSCLYIALIEGEGGRFQRAGGSFGKTWQGCEKSDYYLYLPIGKVKGPHHSYKSSRLSFSITSINITQMKTHRLNIVLGCLSLVVTTVWTHKHTILFWLFQHQQLQNKAHDGLWELTLLTLFTLFTLVGYTACTV